MVCLASERPVLILNCYACPWFVPGDVDVGVGVFALGIGRIGFVGEYRSSIPVKLRGTIWVEDV